MPKIYPYVDAADAADFKNYASQLGLEAAPLLRLLIVRRLRRGRPASMLVGQIIAMERAEVPVGLSAKMHGELVRFAKVADRSPSEIAAEEILLENRFRTLERFLLDHPAD